MTDSIEELQERLREVTQERNKYHAELVDMRLTRIEARQEDHEKRIRPLEDGQVKANTIYALFVGNGLLSIIALLKVFL